jgi:hypothetical protein
MASPSFIDIFIDKHPEFLSILDIIIRESAKCLEQFEKSQIYDYKLYEKCMLDFIGDKSRIDDRDLPENLQEVFVREKKPGDGNCFYHTFAAGLNRMRGTSYTHADIRKIVCDYMAKNLKHLKAWGITKEYIATMRQDGTYGGGPELAFLQRIFNCFIAVYDMNGTRTNGVLPHEVQARTIYMYHNNALGGQYRANHYDLLVLRNPAVPLVVRVNLHPIVPRPEVSKEHLEILNIEGILEDKEILGGLTSDQITDLRTQLAKLKESKAASAGSPKAASAASAASLKSSKESETAELFALADSKRANLVLFKELASHDQTPPREKEELERLINTLEHELKEITSNIEKLIRNKYLKYKQKYLKLKNKIK